MSEEIKRKRLIAARKKLGLTQKDVADLLEISQASISQYENGKTELGYDQTNILADEFGLDRTDFHFLEKHELNLVKKERIPNQLKLYQKKNKYQYLRDTPMRRDIPILKTIENPMNPNIYPLENHKRIISSNSGGDFAYEYFYDNMSPSIIYGDLVFVKTLKRPTSPDQFNGELYLVSYSFESKQGESKREIFICRAFSNNDTIILKSDNHNCYLLTISTEELDNDVVFIGKIIQLQRNFSGKFKEKMFYEF